MSRLVNLYTDDGRVVVGRTNVRYPISVNVGYSLTGPVLAGFAPYMTQIQTGWIKYRNNEGSTPVGTWWSIDVQRNRPNSAWAPTYASVYGAWVSPFGVFGAVYGR